MQIISQIKVYWLRIAPDRRAKILYEIGSVINTFVAAFLLQACVDIEAAKFMIPLDTMTWVALATAAARAGVKAVLTFIVGAIRARFGSKV